MPYGLPKHYSYLTQEALVQKPRCHKYVAQQQICSSTNLLLRYLQRDCMHRDSTITGLLNWVCLQLWRHGGIRSPLPYPTQFSWRQGRSHLFWCCHQLEQHGWYNCFWHMVWHATTLEKCRIKCYHHISIDTHIICDQHASLPLDRASSRAEHPDYHSTHNQPYELIKNYEAIEKASDH